MLLRTIQASTRRPVCIPLVVQSRREPIYNFIAERNEINLIEHDFAIRSFQYFCSFAPARDQRRSCTRSHSLHLIVCSAFSIGSRCDFTLTLALRCLYPFDSFHYAGMACGRPIKCCSFQFNGRHQAEETEFRRQMSTCSDTVSYLNDAQLNWLFGGRPVLVFRFSTGFPCSIQISTRLIDIIEFDFDCDTDKRSTEQSELPHSKAIYTSFGKLRRRVHSHLCGASQPPNGGRCLTWVFGGVVKRGRNTNRNGGWKMPMLSSHRERSFSMELERSVARQTTRWQRINGYINYKIHINCVWLPRSRMRSLDSWNIIRFRGFIFELKDI